MIPDHVQIQLNHFNAKKPTKGSEHAAGYDLFAIEEMTIRKGQWAAVETGVALQIPPGYYAKIEARSGLAAKRGIETLAGVIDSDFRGSIKAILLNNCDLDFIIHAGDRVAQIIFLKHESPELVEVNFLSASQRGQNGFGSSGI
jgi:dUTP pyrophosphatase